MDVQELDTLNPDRRQLQSLAMISAPVRHTAQSLAYRVQDPQGKSLVYSGDTAFCDEIVHLARGCDLLILECSFPDDEDAEGHLTPSLAGRVASLAGVKKLLLIHFYPEVLKTDIAAACRESYAGELILGRDLLHISL
jgi:ribonuclease BN (tRNA processing enzyme)